jgi:hypothetical protein
MYWIITKVSLTNNWFDIAKSGGPGEFSGELLESFWRAFVCYCAALWAASTRQPSGRQRECECAYPTWVVCMRSQCCFSLFSELLFSIFSIFSLFSLFFYRFVDITLGSEYWRKRFYFDVFLDSFLGLQFLFSFHSTFPISAKAPQKKEW